MATSGSFSTNYCTPVSKTWYWDLSWWVSSWSGNTATINYEVYSRCTSGTSGKQYISNYGFSGSIAGNSFSSSNTFYKDVLIASGSFTLSGGTYFEASITAHPYSGSNTSSGSKGWTLDNNVVTPTVTVSISSRTETTITASMSVTNNGNAEIVDKYIDLFTDSSCTNNVGYISGASGTFTGLTANTTYYARATANNGTYRGYSSVSSTSTYQYPYISAVDSLDLTIGNQQKLTLYNPLGRSVNIYMKKDNTSGTTLFSKTGATTGTSYSFTPTASTLYNSIPASTSGNCVYYCTYSDHTVSSKSGTYKVSGNNAQAPTFTAFNYKDSDSLASQLTGKNGVNNPGILIAGLSDCQFNITTSQKTTSSYGATLDHYNFAWPNGTGGSELYSTSANVSHTVQNGNTTIISVTAYDKRGQHKTVQKTVTLITPSHTSGSPRADRQNGIDSVTYLNGNIQYWSGDWANGSSRPNTLLKVEYRVNKTGSYYDITSAVRSNSTSSTSGKITTLNLKSNIIQLHANGSSGGFTVGTSYTVEIFISTGVSSSIKYENRYKIAEITVTSGIFGMSRYKDSSGKYHYGINGLPKGSSAFYVNGRAEVKDDIIGTFGIVDTRDINSPPSYYHKSKKGIVNEFKTCQKIDNPFSQTYANVLTITPWADQSGGRPTQIAMCSSGNTTDGIKIRHASSDSAWGAWKELPTFDKIYPVGSIYISNTNTNPSSKFGGTWVSERTFYGGELLAFGTVYDITAGDTISDYKALSEIMISAQPDITNYVSGILSYTSNAFLVTIKNLVGLVELDVTLSGRTDSNGYGIWGHINNKNALPSGVTLIGSPNYLKSVGSYNRYGGTTFKYFYKVTSTSTSDTFYLNPRFESYPGGSEFYPGDGGVGYGANVKVFAKGGTRYMWRRTA